jgi:predicted dehydrogenase
MGISRLRLGIVGCGDSAHDMGLANILVPRVKITACCDRIEEKARRFAKKYRVLQTYTRYSDLLTSADLDAVFLAVPHNLHYEMVLAAVELGKAVLVEKPITRTLDEGIRVVEALGNSKVGVNYQYRYDSGCYALSRAIQAGELGRIHSVRINVPWHREQSYFDGAAWHKTIAQAGGGTLITQGSHFLDVVLWALNEKPLSAMGYQVSPGFDVEVDTLVHGIIQTSGGTLVNITSSMVAASEQAVTIEFYGERGTGRYRNLPLPSVKFIGVRVRKERPPVWGVHALQRSLAGFARWVLDNEPFLIPAESALPVLAAVETIYRSTLSGKQEQANI